MKKLWFRAKLYGWGWYPCSWEGWLVTLAFIVLIGLSAARLVNGGSVTFYLVSLLILTAVLIAICYKTGEKPRWRWGK